MRVVGAAFAIDTSLEIEPQRTHDDIWDGEPQGIVVVGSGTDAAITKAVPVAARVIVRTARWVVSAGLRVHVNWVHAHQISQNSSRDRTAPDQVRSCASATVIWVTAKTKTRSKNSSTNVTDCDSGACSELDAIGRQP